MSIQIHHILIILAILIGFIIILKLISNIKSYRSEMDYLLIIIHLTLGLYLFLNLIKTLMVLLYNEEFPFKFIIEPIFLKIGQLVSLTFIFSAILITIHVFNEFFRSAGVKFEKKKYKQEIIILLLCLIFIINLIWSEVYYIDDFPLIINKNPLLNVLLSFSTFLFILATYGPSFLRFLKITIKNSETAKKEKIIFTGYLSGTLMAMVFYFIFLINFGFNWTIIIILDFFLLIFLLITCYDTFSHSLKLLNVSRLNLESLFIIHNSGILIYSHHFKDSIHVQEQIFSAFLNSLNDFLNEIRMEGGNVEKLYLDDNSAIIFSIAKYYRGVLITQKYSKIYEEKLNKVISHLDTLESTYLKAWDGDCAKLEAKIGKIVGEFFSHDR